MTSETIVASALLDLSRAAMLAKLPWALVGGEALIAYGVPRETLDADAIVQEPGLETLADSLVRTFGWRPLVYDHETGDYVEADEVEIHYMDDPVLFDVNQERRMVPLRSPLGLPVELLAAQHPIEQEMIDAALVCTHHGVGVPLAPLGGVLLVKTKADRTKDVAAIEQVAEHLSNAQVQEAVAWAERRDAATAEDLRSILAAARTRRAPRSTKPYRGKR